MAVKKKKGLGRGLDALISPTTSLTTHSETTAPKKSELQSTSSKTEADLKSTQKDATHSSNIVEKIVEVPVEKVVEKIVGTGTEGAYVNTAAAVNFTSVKVGDKSGTSIEAGDKFELSMKEFTIGTGKDAKDYVMVVVTCKAQVKSAS